MEPLLTYLNVFRPGIIATVVAGVTIWILRRVLGAIARGVGWILVSIWRSIVNAVKWRIGWY